MASGTQRAQELLGNTKCDICDTYKDVLWRCLNCQETLCNQCKTYHLRSRATKNHTVTELANTANGKDESTSIFCPDHENEVFQKYCTTCNSLVCINCITGTHKHHEYRQIGDIVKQNKTQLEEVFEQMKTITIPKFEQSIVSITEKQMNYNQEIEKLITEITTKGKVLKQAIDEITDKLKNQLMQQATKDEQSLKETKEQIDTYLTKLKMQLNELEQQVQKFNDFDIVSKAASIKDFLSQLTNDSERLVIPSIQPPIFQTCQNNDEDLQKMIGLLVFEMNKISGECPCEKDKDDKILNKKEFDCEKGDTTSQHLIQDWNKHPEYNRYEQVQDINHGRTTCPGTKRNNQQLGHVDTNLETKSNKEKKNPLAVVTSNPNDTENIKENIVFSFKQRKMTKKIKMLNANEAWMLKINTHPSQSNSYVMKLLYLKYMHTYVDLVNDQDKCITSIKLRLNVFDMDTTTSDDLLVTGDHCITKVYRSGETDTFADFSPFYTYGIHVTHTGDVLVGLYNFKHSKVTKLSPLGQKLQVIDYKNMNKPCRIRENINKDIVICDNSKVIVLEENGRYRFEYTGPPQIEMFKEFQSTDISCNQSGQILVADEANNVIHLLDKNGAFIQFLVPHALVCPKGLATNITGKLWVHDENGQVFIVN